MTKRLLNSSDVARALSITPSAISNWRKRGRMPLYLPPADFVTRTVRGDVELWLPETIAPILEARAADMSAEAARLLDG